MESYFDARLMCVVHSIRYDFDTKIADLHLGEGACTDYEGAISLVTTIDPRAEKIVTWAGAKKDTVYFREGETWSSRQNGLVIYGKPTK